MPPQVGAARERGPLMRDANDDLRPAASRRHRTRTVTGASTCLVLLLGACGGTPDGGETTTEQPVAQEASDTAARSGGQAVTTVKLPEGSSFTFITIEQGIGILAEVAPGAPELASFPLLTEAPLQDIFWALSEPGTEVPEQIVALSEPSIDLGPQGWAREAAARGDYVRPRSHCSNSTFMNVVNSKGYNDSGTPVFRLNQLVGSSAFFVPHVECFGTNWVGGCPTFYQYEVNGKDGSYFYNVDAYYTRVAICGLGQHPTITSNYGTVWNHPGPSIEFWHRREHNAGGWQLSFNKDIPANQVGWVYAWHWLGNSSTHNNFDWRTQIQLAKPGDYFDIGHAIEHYGW